MLTALNEDVLKLLSTHNFKTWQLFAQTCRYFQRFNDQESLKCKFLIRWENFRIAK